MRRYELDSSRGGQVKLKSLSAVALFILVLAGCQAVGQAVGQTPARSGSDSGTSAEPVGPGPSGVFQGALIIGRSEMPAALELVRDGRRGLRGFLQAVSGLEAEGEGRLDGTKFQLELVYGGECPGRMALTGDWDPETESLSGAVQGTDCTGAGKGTFRFSAN